MSHVKLVLGIGLLLFGAGCASKPTDVPVEEPLELSNTWFMTGGEGEWYAMKPYWQANVAFGQEAVRSELIFENRTWVQNTSEPILLPGYPTREDLTYTDRTDWVLLDVTAYPVGTKMPQDATVTTYGDNVVGVRQSGVNTVYYWEGSRLYEFYLYSGSETDLTVIFSALREPLE